MTRILLALLALLGLAVQPASAEATANRGAGSAEIGSVAVPGAQVRTVTQRVCAAMALACRPSQRQASQGTASPATWFIEPAPVVPAVLQGIDRARE